jgi:alpha-galactosidase
MDILRIDTGAATLALARQDPHPPRLLYLGARLADDLDLAAAAAALAPGRRESRPDVDPGLTLLPHSGWGDMAEPAIVVEPGLPRWVLTGAVAKTHALSLTYAADGLELVQRLAFTAAGLLTASTELRNTGDQPVRLHWLAALALPLPDWIGEARAPNGRWGAEFALSPVLPAAGRAELGGRAGRTGFQGGAHLVLGEAPLRNELGRVLGAHLAWSGDARSLIEALPSGERQLQIGARLAPGEVVLAPGVGHTTPEALLAISDIGLNGLRSAFHAELRDRRRAAGVGQGSRKVHMNSWEACYFDISEPRLFALADAAAAVGAERFVLDDGWFRGRRDDRTSLGDWIPDPDRFPDGLDPLIAHVRARGMDFGLWVEPEMVSPDSELYRRHPDWCLHVPGAPRPTQRQQLVLDLARPEVRDHLVAALDEMLSVHAIAYLKWDHNRDLFPAPSGSGAQVAGFYAILDALRARHPAVEIESCASGGGRIDFGVMGRAARAWASDNTDPAVRLRIHEAMSLFYPPEVTGAHVGAAPNPSTGRAHAMAFRARAMFVAHLGVEADPARMTAEEREVLATHIALWKSRRDLIASGRQSFVDCDDPDVTVQIVTALDRRSAIASAIRATEARAGLAPPIRLPGLDPAIRYRIRLIEPWPLPAARHLADAEGWRGGRVLSGTALAGLGIRLPLVHPDTAWLIDIEAEDDR